MNFSPSSRRGLLLALFSCAALAARAQNIGVGTLTPSEKLDVVGGNLKISTAGSSLIFPDGTVQTTAASGTGTGSFILNGPASQQTGSFNLSGTGTLGGALQAGTNVGVDRLGANAGTITNALRFGAAGTGEGIGSRRVTGSNQFGLDFYTSSAARLSIANGGNVGIGLTDPQALLDVNGSTRLRGLNTAGVVTTDALGNLSSSTGSGSFIQNQTAAAQTGGFNLSGAGTLGNTLTAPQAVLRSAGGGFLEIQNSSATASTPYVDFSESSGTVDYSTRLISQSGTLNVYSTAATTALQVNGGLAVDGANSNTGTAANFLRFGASGSGEGIGSKRNAGGNVTGLDFYTSFTNRMSISNGGSVGIGTTAPASTLDVRTTDGTARLTVGTTGGTGGGIAFGNTGHGIQRGYPTLNADNNVGFYTTGGYLYLSANGAATNKFILTDGGNVGIGTSIPGTRLDVVGGGSNGVDLRVNGRLQSGDANNQGGVWLNSANSQFVGQFDATKLAFYNDGWRMVVDNTGKVGIGTTGPAFPLDVQTTATTGAYSFGYLNPAGQTGSGSIGANGVGISIRATGRILSSEFNAVSDRRLKTVVGLSDRTADLALLNQLRITNYTMRDRVTFGDRAFKKVIAQEVEAVFPQAVQQQTGFLPDVYALATAVQVLPGDSLVALTLPAVGLPTAATAGQRLKLVGEQGEVQAALARPAAAGARVLVLRRATALAGTKVFVFGLEHADVRSVDYEALAMLNVSATQELARKVEALEKQNAALQTGSAADHASLLTLQAQMARLLGAGAQAQK